MPPFSKEAQLVQVYEPAPKAPPNNTLRGYPLVMLDDASRMKQFLEKELWSEDLETMAPRLWIMTTISSGTVTSTRYSAPRLMAQFSRENAVYSTAPHTQCKNILNVKKSSRIYFL